MTRRNRLTRRAFLSLGATALLAGCTGDVTGTSAGTSGSKDTDGSSSSDVRELVEPTGSPTYSGIEQGHVSPDPAGMEGTVLSAAVDLAHSQTFFLWEEGNVPATTDASADGTGSDPAGFRPSLTSYPVPEGTPVKGAMLLCSGGAFRIRSDNAEGGPSAGAFARLGYQSFVVDYRIRPYTQQEGGVDLARAICFVHAHAEDYGLPNTDAIAIGGFSAGGIQCGETLLNWKADVSPQTLDPSYVPDTLDSVSASAAACAMVYSFYGRLSVAEKDGDVLLAGNLPPTYYCYGTEDPFYDQFEGQVGLMSQLGYTVRARVLDGWPHGFGAEGGWIPEFDRFAQEAFAVA